VTADQIAARYAGAALPQQLPHRSCTTASAQAADRADGASVTADQIAARYAGAALPQQCNRLRSSTAAAQDALGYLYCIPRRGGLSIRKGGAGCRRRILPRAAFPHLSTLTFRPFPTIIHRYAYRLFSCTLLGAQTTLPPPRRYRRSPLGVSILPFALHGRQGPVGATAAA